jgi:hypothetical protein
LGRFLFRRPSGEGADALRNINLVETLRQLPLTYLREHTSQIESDVKEFLVCRLAGRPREHGATRLQIGGEAHGQLGKQPLRKLWRTIRSRLPSPLGSALLPQSLQGQLPCKNRQHKKVARLSVLQEAPK